MLSRIDQLSGAVMPNSDFDVVIVGAGLGGLYALYRLRQEGFTVHVVEAGPEVGGTWYWNRYPGARCDVDSLYYSYSFSEELQQEWHWTERYAGQAEILRYIRFVAERFDLKDYITFNSRVVGMKFGESENRWRLDCADGRQWTAKFCIMATGCLSVPRIPELPGMEAFRGSVYHTADWPHDGVDFRGKTVGIIGTGSSAIQSIPLIAQEAVGLTVFQRTPAYSVPARNTPMSAEIERAVKQNYGELRRRARNSSFGVPVDVPIESALEVSEEDRRARFERGWESGGLQPIMSAFNDLMLNIKANDTAAEFIRSKIREIVHDPEVAEQLLPSYPVGAKRACLDTSFYQTFNRPNVRLVDLKSEPIASLTSEGIQTTASLYRFDAIVLATGFDAMTGALLAIDIVGADGLGLRQKWADGPTTYLGLMIASFPNMFLITGPGSPSVRSNMILSIEQHVDWIAGCLKDLRREGYEVIEPSSSAEVAWVEHVRETAERTLFPLADSWYNGANIEGKPRVYMPYVGGVDAYREICDDVADNRFLGFLRGRSTDHARVFK
jgi:cation diffusion facilitator CzcD-associated flavoprotein CzcO